MGEKAQLYLDDSQLEKIHIEVLKIVINSIFFKIFIFLNYVFF